MTEQQKFPLFDVPLENHSTFAYRMTAAMSSYLDGLASIGGRRKACMNEAARQAGSALSAAHTKDEKSAAVRFGIAMRVVAEGQS